MDLKELKKKNKELDIIVRTLSKTTITSQELYSLEKDHPGIIIRYWNIYWQKTLPKFVGNGSFWELIDRRSPEEEEEVESKAVSEEPPKEALDVDAMIQEIKRKYE